MDSRFASASVNELESILDTLFDIAPRIPCRDGVDFGLDPVIRHMFIEGQDRSAHRLLVCKALVAGAKFRHEAPGWPPLPFRPEDIEEMQNAECIRCNVVGYFGDSLRGEAWSLQHPGFAPFVSGLMFDQATPVEIRSDPELQQQFPPAKLKGMTDGSLTWRSPEVIYWARRNRLLIAEHEVYEAAQAAGLLPAPSL